MSRNFVFVRSFSAPVEKLVKMLEHFFFVFLKMKKKPNTIEKQICSFCAGTLVGREISRYEFSVNYDWDSNISFNYSKRKGINDIQNGYNYRTGTFDGIQSL